ncbi:MAG TPA: DUF4124 domain-containing protein [Steroidobacteraceae bacterium]|nr:DUF4124 domain-containing protein [Steroidobacteraceae bacterium]
MKNRHFLLALAGTLALSCTAAHAATKAYKWIDKDGVVHYGDTVPPEYSEQEHQELNEQGVPVRDFPRQLTPAEANAAQQTASEEARRHQHDSYLLNTYTKVADIEQIRDEHIEIIDGQMELARDSITATEQRIVGLQKRLGLFKPYSSSASARRVPDELAVEVVRALAERRSMLTQLQQRQQEKADQLATFAADIARYRELTAGSSARRSGTN